MNPGTLRAVLQTCAALIFTVGIPLLTRAGAPAPAGASNLSTVAERSGYARTGRYDEVERLCAAFASRWPDRVRCGEFGRTPEGRPMLVLVASGDGTLDPGLARERKRPVVLFQGGVHAGEIDGKDAGFKALQEILEGREQRDALSRVTVLFVPVYNVDGHERFGRWNRPNQRGPEEMGWRTTAQNLNLNRDYMKAEAPETRAMLGLLNSWDPILYVDLHVTDGAQFREEISVEIEPGDGWDLELGRTGHAIRDAVLAHLQQQKFLALPFYPSFVKQDEPESGFEVTVRRPRHSTSYLATRNRFGALVETHSWLEYPRRVAATRATILAMVGLAARDGTQWLAAAGAADARAAAIGGKPVPLTFRNSAAVRMVDFHGYAYTREQSAISGQLWIRYDETRPRTWRLPLKYEVVPDLTVTAPARGYLVPAAHAAWLAERLTTQGLRFEVMTQAEPRAVVQSFLAGKVAPDAKIAEGRVSIALTGTWREDTRDIPAGSLFVPIAQPKARLVMSLFEPQAPDSYASWGYFDAAFEQKEYMEDYVIEAVARDMLAKDPALKTEFERRLREDATFAADPEARLAFFYRRHPAWDDRAFLYPVYRR
jgi:hypothetical protein